MGASFAYQARAANLPFFVNRTPANHLPKNAMKTTKSVEPECVNPTKVQA
jgi:hypothetical protein